METADKSIEKAKNMMQIGFMLMLAPFMLAFAGIMLFILYAIIFQ